MSSDDDRYIIRIRWGLGGPLKIQPIVFIKPPAWAEAGSGGQYALLEQLAEVAAWANHKAEVLGGNFGVMVTVNASHFSQDKPPRYISALIKRINASGIDIPRHVEFEVSKIHDRKEQP